MPEEPKKKKCFVIMGFGEKTDLATSRTLNLDKTYRIIIKKAVEEAGLECIRADEVMHAGIIDKPMYELLHEADVVVADLSTSNANAIYELGVRHALRPYTTIVIAESQFKFPFDIGHLLVRPYEHLGKGIDEEEAEKVRAELIKAIRELTEKQSVDSPVHTFLPKLLQPAGAPDVVAAAAEPAPAAPDQTAAELMKMFQNAKAAGKWMVAASFLEELLKRRPTDDYLLQQLALATYKSKSPDAETALHEAKKILAPLNPKHTTDPETLGLWGAIHKRLWEIKKDRADLDQSIWAYEKGYYLKDDYYNGINFAFLLNWRATVSPKREAIADFVTAERVRRRIISLCEEVLTASFKETGSLTDKEQKLLMGAGVKDEKGQIDRQEKFWLQATLVEALVGIGETEKAKTLKEAAIAEAPESWMADTMNEQLAKLEGFIADAPSV